MKEKFKFNIKEPISKEAINELKSIDKNAFKIFLTLSLLLSIAAICFCFYKNLFFLIYIYSMMGTMSLSIFISLLYRMLKLKSTINSDYLNFEDLPQRKCKDVSEWIDEHDEIKLYMKKLSEDCRQLTCYEYYEFREFVALREKETTEEESEKYCKRIYQQDYSI